MKAATAMAGLAAAAFNAAAIAGGAARGGPVREIEAPRLELPRFSFEPREAASPAAQPEQTSFEEVLREIEQPENGDAPQPLGADADAERIPFGRAGSEFWTFGGGVAHNLRQDMDYNLHVAWSRFLADEFEMAVEAGGWYFHQKGDDTIGLNGNLIFRWHLFHPKETPVTEAWDWTVYTDLGIGMMGSFDNVPRGGTGFTFTPRAGWGFTKQIAEDGTRMQMGVRWHHISNGRIEGDVRNPSRDSLMVYAGVIIPF